MPDVERVELQPTLSLKSHDNHEWTLGDPFAAKVHYKDGSAEWVIAPAGFVTDLASVPRLPGMFLFFGGKGRKSAVIHDYLLESGRDRDFADSVFRHALKEEEGAFTRFFMWLGVRAGSAMAWFRPKDSVNEGKV